ncbi:nucleotidyltransferase domain-containing protein [Methanofollis fontis]
MVGPLTEHPAVLAVMLFGSTATGHRRPFSDIDLCIFASHPLRRDEKEELLSNSAPGYDLSLPGPATQQCTVCSGAERCFSAVMRCNCRG